MESKAQLLNFLAVLFEWSRDYSVLAAASAVSKGCRRLCVELLRSHAQPTRLVADLSCEAQLQSISSRQWSAVLTIAARTAASSDTELAALVLLTTPNFSQGDARKAFRAGLWVSYDQLVLAARLHIPGIEVWPRAVISVCGHFVGEATNHLHHFAIHCVCCRLEGAAPIFWEGLLPQLNLQAVSDLLYVAVNLSDTTTATFIATQFHRMYCFRRPGCRDVPEVPAKVIHELLVTAIHRGNHSTFSLLSQFPAAQHLVLDMSTNTPHPNHVTDLQDAQLVSNLAALFKQHLLLHKWDRNARAAEEPADSLLQLCQLICGNKACETALSHVLADIAGKSSSPDHGSYYTGHLATLCDLPVAQHLTADQAVAALIIAVQTGNAAAAGLVAALPGASMLTPRQVCELLRAGADQLCFNPGYFLFWADAHWEAHAVPAYVAGDVNRPQNNVDMWLSATFRYCSTL